MCFFLAAAPLAASATVAGGTAASLGVAAGSTVAGSAALAATGPLLTAGGVTAATGAASGLAAASSAGLFSALGGTSGIIGLGLSGVSTFAQIMQQRQLANAQAAQFRNQAAREKSALALREEDRKRRLQIALSTQRARAGTTGATVSSFSSLFGQTAAEFTRDSFVDRFQTSSNIADLRASASNAELEGRQKGIGTLTNFITTNATRFS